MRTEAELHRLMRMRVEPGERGEAIIVATITRLRETASSSMPLSRGLRPDRQRLTAGSAPFRQSLTENVRRPAARHCCRGSPLEGFDEETLARQYLVASSLKPAMKRTLRAHRRLVAAGFSTGVIS